MYTKLFSDILQSSLWAEDSEVRIVWITLLALASRDGLVRATAPGIAHEARISLPKTQKALKLFESPDPYSRTPDNEGRRIERVDGGYLILNYVKYRAISTQDDRREQTRIRNQAYRARKERKVAKERNSDSDTDAKRDACETQRDANASHTHTFLIESFGKFYRAYPPRRRSDKAIVFAEWKKVADSPETVTRIMDRLHFDKSSHDWAERGGQFVVNADTWLSRTPWEQTKAIDETPDGPNEAECAAINAECDADEEALYLRQLETGEYTGWSTSKLELVKARLDAKMETVHA